MRAIVILGKKPGKNGDTSELEARVNVGVEELKRRKWDVLVVSGGATKAGFPMEAELGAQFARKRLGNDAPLRLERWSRSTMENIKNLRGLFPGVRLTGLVFVTSRYHMPRVKWLVGLFLPEIAAIAEYVPVPIKPTVGNLLSEAILLVLAFIDPNERIFLPFFKKFRHG